MDDSLIIIFIAETDPDYVYQISSDIQKQFQKHLGKHYSETGAQFNFQHFRIRFNGGDFAAS